MHCMNEIRLGKIKKVYYHERVKRNFKPAINAKRKSIKFSNFRKTFIIAGLFAIITPLALATLHEQVNQRTVNAYTLENNDLIISSNTNNSEVLGTETISVYSHGIDERAYVFDQYFIKENSPLQGMGRKFVEACDKYGAPKDCITLVAIAKHETNLCKYQFSAEMHNCIGWGGGGSARVQFASFEEMIDRATYILVSSYGYDMMVNPSLMESVFCGKQAECTNWGNRIKSIMNDIDKYSESLGFGKLSELR